MPIPVMIICLLFAAFTQQRLGSIRGRIVPQNGAVGVWAVSDTDTGHAVVQNGEFEIKQLRPGRYRVIADGKRPYKVTTRPDVVVADSNQVNIGDIILDQ